MIDASIPLQVQPAKYDDPSNQLMRILQIQGLQDARTKEQRALEQQTAMNDAYGGALGADGNLDRNKLYSLLAGKGQGSQIPAAQKTYADLDNKQSDTDKNKALATKDTTEAENKTIAMYRDASTAITDPVSAIEFVKHMHTDPRLKDSAIARVPIEQALAQIPQDPNQLAAWKQQFALGATKFMELNKPTTNVVNTGGQTQMVQTPGLGGAPTVAQSFQNTQSPDNAATNATHVQTANIAASTARQNNAATIQKDYNIAGIDPSGGGATQDLRQMAQAIAEGKLQPPTGMALNHPRMQLLMNEVMKINPDFDATSYGAKAKAARDFTSGNQGNAMRSFQVAGQHLDQLGQLVDALGNGDMQILNKVGNMYATQTGSPAPTNFEAAKDVVSKEVVKAIVAGGGGVAERQELSNLMSQAKSPAQLKGVIQQYRNLMAAQHDALLQQRDAAGLPRSTLPNYTESGGSKPAGTPDASAIDAELRRRGVK